MAKGEVMFQTTNLFWMKVCLVCSLALIAIVTGENWHLHSEKAFFEYHSIQINTNKLFSTNAIPADSLTACCMQCVSIKGMVPLHSYYIPDQNSCLCNLDIGDTTGDEIKTDALQCVLERLVKVEFSNRMDRRLTAVPYPMDCLTWYENNYTKDGVYVIWPRGGLMTDVWCDMTNGGWSVIQRRMDGSEDFTRGWLDYVHGFGNRTGEYWLGLENIHRLTDNDSELVVHIEAYFESLDPQMTLSFDNFKVGGKRSNYVLHVKGYSPPCGKMLVRHNGMPFSTFDKDNDIHASQNCAANFHGGWWYSRCLQANLNGLYSKKTTGYGGIRWRNCFNSSLKFAVMKIKPKRLS